MSTHVDKIANVIIPVADQDRALQFYTEAVGLETRADLSFGDGNRWIEVAPRGAVITIALISSREGLRSGVETGIRFTSADADADHADLRARGVSADDVLHWPGVPPMFAFRDQDGNGFEIVEQR